MDTSDTPKLPARGERFTDPSARAVWAAILSLPAGPQHLILDELRTLLGRVDRADSHQARVRHAIGALRECAEILDRSPSIADYRLLRAQQPQLKLPADGSLRGWLGGTWNDCLRQAQLAEVPDGDVVVAQNGAEFTRDEVVAALCECAKELGDIPTYHRYTAWARKKSSTDPQRRPASQAPFTRLYGERGFRGGLADANLINESPNGHTRQSRVRVGSYFVTTETCAAALKLVAKRLGRSPRVAEYMAERERILNEPVKGKLRPLPAASSIQARFDDWDQALTSAGLEPLGGRATRSDDRPRTPAGPQIPLREIVACLVEAYGVCGEPFTGASYKAWRKKQVDVDGKARRLRRIPSYDVIWSRLGGWNNAVTIVYRAIDLKKAAPVEIDAALDEILDRITLPKHGRKRGEK
jgi:hypothetical protein